MDLAEAEVRLRGAGRETASFLWRIELPRLDGIVFHLSEVTARGGRLIAVKASKVDSVEAVYGILAGRETDAWIDELRGGDDRR